MRDLFWRIVARVVCFPLITRLIIASACKRPFFHLGGYMRRWWFIRPMGPRAADGLRRGYAVRLHHILRADADLVLHDHPIDFRTIILRGWYIEEDAFGEERVLMRGDTKASRAETLHRINRVSSGGVWTLFIMGAKRIHWGFMVGDPPRKCRHEDYHSNNPQRIA
jgi:hypothetical protein